MTRPWVVTLFAPPVLRVTAPEHRRLQREARLRAQLPPLYRLTLVRRSDSWVHSMDNAQVEVQTILADNRSFSADLPAFVAQAYAQACHLAARETRLSPLRFPGGCPWTPEQLLSPKFLDDTLAESPS